MFQLFILPHAGGEATRGGPFRKPRCQSDGTPGAKHSCPNSGVARSGFVLFPVPEELAATKRGNACYQGATKFRRVQCCACKLRSFLSLRAIIHETSLNTNSPRQTFYFSSREGRGGLEDPFESPGANRTLSPGCGAILALRSSLDTNPRQTFYFSSREGRGGSIVHDYPGAHCHASNAARNVPRIDHEVARRTSRRREEILRLEALQSLRLIVEARDNVY
jgi:hypothetical protein